MTYNWRFVKLKVDLKFNYKIMEAQIIGIKQLHKQLKQVSEQTVCGKSFIVVKNSTPVFRIEPMNDKSIGKEKYTLADFKKIQFKSKHKNLSKNIDKIVYNL